LDILFFLKLRTDFIRRHYDVCVAPFLEQKRLIDAAEPPFHDPPYSEDGEPAYLDKWIDADTSIQLVGVSCVSLLSDALKLYLNLLQRRQLRFIFEDQEAKRLKKDFLATYLDALGEIFATDWTETGIDFAVIEQVLLARNRGQHGTNLTSFHLAHDERTMRKHPVPFFVSESELRLLGGSGRAFSRFLAPAIVITRDTLFAAIGEVEKLGEWIETNGERTRPWLEAQHAARQAGPQQDGPADWPTLLPAFAAHIAEAAARAADFQVEEPKLQVVIDLPRLNDEGYSGSVLEQARTWRGGSDKSVIYVFSFEADVPQDLIKVVRDAADGSLRGMDQARAFPKVNAAGHSRCLYVGHSFKIETRLREPRLRCR